MDESDVLTAIQAGDTDLLQWYVLTHPASTNLQSITSSATGTTISTVGSSQTVLLLAVVALAAFLFLK